MSEETGSVSAAVPDAILPVTGRADGVATEMSDADVAPNTNNGVNEKPSAVAGEGTRQRALNFLPLCDC